MVRREPGNQGLWEVVDRGLPWSSSACKGRVNLKTNIRREIEDVCTCQKKGRCFPSDKQGLGEEWEIECPGSRCSATPYACLPYEVKNNQGSCNEGATQSSPPLKLQKLEFYSLSSFSV